MSTDDRLLYRNFIKVLNAQQRALIEARAPEELLNIYKTVVRYLSDISDEDLRRILHPSAKKQQQKPTKDTISLFEASTLSLDQVERLLADANTSRKTLETIAIARFQVPRGSMRSFANIDRLKEKLTTLVQNERTHLTISSIAQHPRSS